MGVVHRPSLNLPSIALFCKDYNRYLAMDLATGLLSCSSAVPWNFTYSRVMGWSKTKRVIFQVPESGRYVAGEPTATNQILTSDESKAAPWKVFLVGGYETLRPMIRGVNLGNWFLLEKWVAGDLFNDAANNSLDDTCTALDEYGLMNELGPEVAKPRMEHHWANWISEDDII